MNHSQIQLIQRSFAQLAPDADLIADLLCARLFQLDPMLRSLLPNDLRQPKGDMIHLITAVIDQLNQPGHWEKQVRELGKESILSGASVRTFETFGTALIWTLEKGIGEQFTFDVLEAWVAFYALLSNTMQGIETPRVCPGRQADVTSPNVMPQPL